MNKNVVSMIVVLSLYMCSLSFSATPNKVNYQGVLKEKGQLITGTRKMKFAIYDAETGGNLKWTSGEVNVTVNGGTFRYVLEPTGINWGTGGPYYLELTVEGQVLSPREEVGSSIYALHAKNVDDGSITPSKLVSGQKYEIIAATATSVDWSNIKNIPAGFADGVDNTDAGAGDNLGNHTATQNLNMANYGITNVSTITASGGGLLFDGNVGSILKEGAGTRLLWYPAKSAFRAGYVNGTQWDDTNIGYYSVAMGYNTRASGQYSTAMGEGTTASNWYSTAMGYHTTASGHFSTAMGRDTNASWYASTAMGDHTTASGNYSTAIGQYVTAGSAANTIAIGKGIDDTNRLVNNTANSLMVGFDRTTPTLFVSSSSVGIDNTSMTPGLNVSTINYVSRIVWADGTVQVSSPQAGGGADNLGNHTATQSLNMSSFSIVNVSTITSYSGGLLFSGTAGGLLASGAGTRLMWYPAKAAFRAGYVDGTQWDDTNIGYYSVAMGYKTKASGDYSTAMGYNTTASGNFSTAMGAGTIASGYYSTAMGSLTTASGIISTAIGEYVTASAQNSITIGKGIGDTNRLINGTTSSFMIGFDRTTPTLTVTSYSVTMDGLAGYSENILVLSTGTVKVTRFTGTGNAYSNGTWNSGGADYAEWFEKEEEIKPGDIVGLNLETRKVRKYQSGDVLLGICSSNPGFVGNSNINKSDEEMKKNYVLVGLVGQLDFNKEQVVIKGSKVETKDGKQIGYLLANGKVLLKMQ